MTTTAGVRPVELRPATDAREWDAIVLAQPNATPFHSWTFLELFSRRWDFTFSPQLAFVDGEPVGGVPLVVHQRRGLRWVNHTKQFTYAGPAVRPDHLGGLLGALGARHGLTTMHERHEVRGAPDDAPDCRGWDKRTGTTMTVHLAGRTVDELNAESSRAFRTSPRRAEEHGLVVELADEKALAVTLPEMLRATYGRQGLPSPYDDDMYLTVYEEFAARDEAHALVARVGDDVAAMSLVLVTQNRSYLWVTAQDSEHSVAQPSMAVQRAHVLWSHERGLEAYDLIGGSTPGIARFKRTVGAVDEDFTIYQRGRRIPG
jgi:CelD/BcsL family acetyltransferase involved in cellulose biosynthesis